MEIHLVFFSLLECKACNLDRDFTNIFENEIVSFKPNGSQCKKENNMLRDIKFVFCVICGIGVNSIFKTIIEKVPGGLKICPNE